MEPTLKLMNSDSASASTDLWRYINLLPLLLLDIALDYSDKSCYLADKIVHIHSYK